MEKRISRKDLASIRRIAQNVYPDIEKREKTKRMIDKLTEDYQKIDESIKSDEAGILKKYGIRCEQVFSKVSEPTGKFYDNGKEKRQTKYVLTDNVRYDSDKNEYIVTINDEGDKEVAPVKDENDNEGAPVEAVAEEPVEVADQVVDELVEESVAELEVKEPEVVEEQPVENFEEMFAN